MQKKFWRALIVSSLLTNSTFLLTPAHSMMSASEEREARSLLSRCQQTNVSPPGHQRTEVYQSSTALWCQSRGKPSIKGRGTRQGGSTPGEHYTWCPQCDALHEKLSAHNAASAKQEASASEEAELRKQLLKAQIAALQKK